MILRRTFIGGMGSAACCSLVGAAGAAEPKQQSLRVIAYNVYKCIGWPKGRKLARKAIADGQMARRLAMELALYDPDIINFSESPSEELAMEVAKLLGMNHVRFPSGGNWPGTLLSRFEVTESENAPVPGGKRPEDLFTRHWGRATLKLPKGDDLIVHSAHLMPGQTSEVRLREIDLMIESMKNDLAANKQLLLIGDLNHTPDSAEYDRWIKAGYTDTFVAVGGEGGPTIPASKPEWRIDYVFAAGPLASGIKQSRPLYEGAFRIDPDDQHSFALSDHLPQFASFELKR